MEGDSWENHIESMEIGGDVPLEIPCSFLYTWDDFPTDEHVFRRLRMTYHKKNWPQHLSRFFCWAIHTWKNILLLVQKSSSFSPVPKWPKIECIHENNLVDKNENTPRIVDSYITCTSLSKDVRMSMFFVLRF